MRRNKVILLFLVPISIIAIITCVVILTIDNVKSQNTIDNQSPEKQAEMLNLTLEWGRLAPIPDCKTDLTIQTEGNAFTRAFRSSFYLPKEDLTVWISSSPGLCDAQIENLNQSIHKYTISPGDGAQYAEATIDYDSGFVQLYVYWS